MSKKLQRIDLHNRINDLRQTHLNQLRVQAREIFRSMLDGLEDTVNERIYANNGDFPEDLIDMLWIVRSIGNKYGLNRTPDESRRRVFYGVNNGQQGRQFEEWLHQIENLDFETSGTSYEFDPELLKQFYAYVISDRLVGRHRGIEDLCTMPEIVHKPLSEENLDELIIPVLGDDSLIITDFGRLRTCLNVGSRLQSEVYSLIGDIYGDIHSLWGYQGEWIAVEANAIMSGNLQFQDIATLQSSNPELEGSRFFKQFIQPRTILNGI